MTAGTGTAAHAARHAQALRLAASGKADATVQQRVLRDLLDEGSSCPPDQVIAALAGRVADGAVADGNDTGTDRVRVRLDTLGGRLVVVGDPDYPPHLADAWPELGAPVWVFVHGAHPPTERVPAVAVVGTRAPTHDGLRTARALGLALASAGITVVSGLARGIDQAAHRGALDGGGRTVAVLGTGLGVDYPGRSARLRAEIADAGALFTELPPGVGPRPWQFLARNRIISGLADATVVVEGRATSGALQTARLAGGQGRAVWAVPGSINAPTSAAPLALLRDGAIPLTSIAELVDDVGDVHAREASGRASVAAMSSPPDLSAAATTVLGLLGAVPATTDVLVAASSLPAPVVMAAVAELVDRGAGVMTAQGVVRA